jgi:hypothetical protein
MSSPVPRRTMRPVFRDLCPARIARLAAAILLAAFAASAVAQTETDPWKSAGTNFWIASPMRLNLGYADPNGKAAVVEVTTLQTTQLAGMPDGLVQARNSDLFTPKHFQSIWTSIKEQVCSDVRQQIQTLVNHSPNTAYDITPCAMNPVGFLWANFQENWVDDSMQNVTGRRIRFNFNAPLNAVAFWVTSPHTCHHGDTCPTEPQDPLYTVVFTVNLNVTCTSTTPNATAFALPATCVPAGTIVIDAVAGGNVTEQLEGAAAKWAADAAAEAASVAASGGATLPAAAAAFVVQGVNVAIKGLGTAIAAASDQHLRDQVSAWLSGYVKSQTLDNSATQASSDFNALFQNLYFATLGGLKPFVFGISPKLDLDFGLIYPAPAKPVIENTTASNNKNSLFSPQIAVAQPEVIAGQTIPVTCTDFRGAYVNALNISWNKTVLGTQKSSLGWGPPDQVVTIAALAFDAANLQPATQYQFKVHECDGITCSPESDVLTTRTEAAGANEVNFWLDNNTSQIIGKSPIGANPYSFMASVMIPASTTSGTHLLHAITAGSQPATATITVCAIGGCGPFIGVMNTQNNTFYPPGSLVGVGNMIVVRGSKFAPGGSVWLWVDGVKGTKAAEAPVGPLGNFQASFRMPLAQAGNHTFVAIELKPGSKIPPTPKGKMPVIPPQDFVSASVAVIVEAAVQ